VRSCGQAGAVPPPGLAEPLTGRELAVLRLLAAGKSNQRIARDLVVRSTWSKRTRPTSWASAAPPTAPGP
jgi:hypothetical protein